MDALVAQAERLRELHSGPDLLVLPNAWDAASARLVKRLGFAAVATSSAAVADSLGFEDGERAPAEEMFAAVRRIASAVEVPVTADLEAGYGLWGGELVGRVIEVGAAGMNIEDSDHSRRGQLVDATKHAERLAGIRDAATEAGVPLVINARVDVHVRQIGEPETRLDAAVERARLYLEAGADCVYPIAVTDEETIAALCAAIPGPVNVLGAPGSPGLARLRELGVARVTYGSRPFHVAMDALEGFASGLAEAPQDSAQSG